MGQPGKKAKNTAQGYKGFTLMELLVSLVIFSLVLLGLMRFLLYSTQKNVHAYYESIAAIQSRSMLNRLRANAGMVYRQREYQQWNVINQLVLPDAHGSYSCRNIVHTCTVTLHWQASGRDVFALTGGVGYATNKKS
jgi:type IV pilus assembly protein PilV